MKFKGLITFITVFCLAFFTSAALAKKSGKSGNSGKSDRHSERSEKSEKSARSEKSDKSCKSHKSSRKGRGRGHGRGHNDCDAPPVACVTAIFPDDYSIEIFSNEEYDVELGVYLTKWDRVVYQGTVCSEDIDPLPPGEIENGGDLGPEFCPQDFFDVILNAGEPVSYTVTVEYLCEAV